MKFGEQYSENLKEINTEHRNSRNGKIEGGLFSYRSRYQVCLLKFQATSREKNPSLRVSVLRFSFFLEERRACTGDAKLSRRRMLSDIQSNLEIRLVKIPLVEFTCRMSRLSDMFSAGRFELLRILNYVSMIKRMLGIYSSGEEKECT